MAGRRRARIAMIVGLCLAVAAGIPLRLGWASWAKRQHRARRRRPEGRRPGEAGGPGARRRRPLDLLGIGPRKARAARAAAIRRTIESIRAECRREAQGDWDRWIARLAPLRDELRVKIPPPVPTIPPRKGPSRPRGGPGRQGSFSAVRSGSGPLSPARGRAEPLEAFRRSRAVIDGSRWLRWQGIDVLFVPVPKMTDVYPESFSDRCPPDRIIAPQMRRVLLELLEQDVEVVDLLGPLLQERDSEAEPLYLPADPHWGPRGHRIAARLIASRLAHYDFVARATASLPGLRMGAGPLQAGQRGGRVPGPQSRPATPGDRRPAAFLSLPQGWRRAPGRGKGPGGLHRR